jgi:hypothetical protein
MLLRFASWMVGALALPCVLLPASERNAAPPAAPEVAVRVVRSELLRQAGGWLEIDVQIVVKTRSASVRFAERVRVTLSLACEPAGPSGTDLRFFRATTEAVALPAGTSHLRFYLPPEVVERDRVRTDRLHSLVELEMEGQSLPAVAAAMSTALHPPGQLARFKVRVAAEAPANDGILVPQVLSPFAFDPRRPAPTVVRRAGE